MVVHIHFQYLLHLKVVLGPTLIRRGRLIDGSSVCRDRCCRLAVLSSPTTLILQAQILRHLFDVVVELRVLLSEVRGLNSIDLSLSHICRALSDWHILWNDIDTRILG